MSSRETAPTPVSTPTTELETVIAIPPIPFRDGRFDAAAHRKNVRYLVERNFLDGARRRAIGIAGTSLIHHVDDETLLETVRVTGEAAGGDAVVMSGLVATPPAAARRYVSRVMALRRAPEYILLMPIPGVYSPEGIAAEFSALADQCGARDGARFLLYLRDAALLDTYARLLAGSAHIVGVKVGTRAEDVARMRALVPAGKQVLWGIGDRATDAARLGSRGHTSGITLVCPRACDEIHNAYFQGDFDRAAGLEGAVAELEEIRFMQGRIYNYSAVVAAAALAGFTDVDLGEGGPYNPAPPTAILDRLRRVVDLLIQYH